MFRNGISDRLHDVLHVLTRLGKRLDAWILTIQYLIGRVDGLLQGGACLFVRHIVLAAVHETLGLLQRGLQRLLGGFHTGIGLGVAALGHRIGGLGQRDEGSLHRLGVFIVLLRGPCQILGGQRSHALGGRNEIIRIRQCIFQRAGGIAIRKLVGRHVHQQIRVLNGRVIAFLHLGIPGRGLLAG